MNKTETKSRYEVIADLEAQKRNLIRERDSMNDKVKEHEQVIKELKRQIEDAELDLKNFKESMDDKRVTITELIKSIDESLKRLSELRSQKK